MSRTPCVADAEGENRDLLSDLTEAGVVEAEAAKTFRAISSRWVDLRRALKKRQPYTGEIFAALREGGDSLSLDRHAHNRRQKHGHCGHAVGGACGWTLGVQNGDRGAYDDGVFISLADGRAYRDDTDRKAAA